MDATPVGDVVAVHVHDTGIGIPADKLDDIFAPFEQVDMSTTRRYGGTGLGLNLAKQLVEAHGGTISVASKRGQGSCFTFTLKVGGWVSGWMGVRALVTCPCSPPPQTSPAHPPHRHTRPPPPVPGLEGGRAGPLSAAQRQRQAAEQQHGE